MNDKPPLQKLVVPLMEAVGVGLTTTLVVAVTVQVASLAVSVYVPAAALVTPVMVGFREVELKLAGPLQLQLVAVPLSVLPVRLKVFPVHIGVLLPATALSRSQ